MVNEKYCDEAWRIAAAVSDEGCECKDGANVKLVSNKTNNTPLIEYTLALVHCNSQCI